MVADSGLQPQPAEPLPPRSARSAWQQGRAALPGSRPEWGGQGGVRGGARASGRGRRSVSGLQRAARPSRVRPWRHWRAAREMLPSGVRARRSGAPRFALGAWGGAAALRRCTAATARSRLQAFEGRLWVGRGSARAFRRTQACYC